MEGKLRRRYSVGRPDWRNVECPDPSGIRWSRDLKSTQPLYSDLNLCFTWKNHESNSIDIRLTGNRSEPDGAQLCAQLDGFISSLSG